VVFGDQNAGIGKCGGLNEALVLIHAARMSGLRVMVGSMIGSSMAMRPAFIAGQFADLVDLDAPLLLGSDTSPSASYDGGFIQFRHDSLIDAGALSDG